MWGNYIQNIRAEGSESHKSPKMEKEPGSSGIHLLIQLLRRWREEEWGPIAVQVKMKDTT
jgi:hypothetical protein